MRSTGVKESFTKLRQFFPTQTDSVSESELESVLESEFESESFNFSIHTI